MLVSKDTITDSLKADRFWAWLHKEYPALTPIEESRFLKDVLELSFPLYKSQVALLATSPDFASQHLADATLRIANHAPAVQFKRSKGEMWIARGLDEEFSDALGFSTPFMDLERQVADQLHLLSKEVLDPATWDPMILVLKSLVGDLDRQGKISLSHCLQLLSPEVENGHQFLYRFSKSATEFKTKLAQVRDERVRVLQEGKEAQKKYDEFLQRSATSAIDLTPLHRDRNLISARIGQLEQMPSRLLMNEALLANVLDTVITFNQGLFALEELMVPTSDTIYIKKYDVRYMAMQKLLAQLSTSLVK